MLAYLKFSLELGFLLVDANEIVSLAFFLDNDFARAGLAVSSLMPVF